MSEPENRLRGKGECWVVRRYSSVWVERYRGHFSFTLRVHLHSLQAVKFSRRLINYQALKSLCLSSCVVHSTKQRHLQNLASIGQYTSLTCHRGLYIDSCRLRNAWYKPGDQSLSPRSHVKVEGEAWPYKVAVWPSLTRGSANKQWKQTSFIMLSSWYLRRQTYFARFNELYSMYRNIL